MKNIKSIFGLVILFLIISIQVRAQQVIIIDVAPHVLNLNNQGEVVTVHTDISYASVDFETVTLNDIIIKSWKSDDRGFFVAKFLMEDVKELEGLILGGMNTLKLVGTTTDGENFTGTQDIMVINNIPEKKGR
jgi:hypothetical protein